MIPNESRLTSANRYFAFIAQTPLWSVMRWGMGSLLILGTLAASVWLAANPEWVLQLGRWGYMGAFLISLIASASIILPIPGLAVIIAMSAVLDPVMLGIVAGIGSALGELSGYIAGATGAALIPERHRPHFDRIHVLTGKHGGLIIAVCAAIPFPLLDFAGIVAGMLRMSLTTFIVATAVGKSLKYIVLILLGAGPLMVLLQFINLLTQSQ